MKSHTRNWSTFLSAFLLLAMLGATHSATAFAEPDPDNDPDGSWVIPYVNPDTTSPNCWTKKRAWGSASWSGDPSENEKLKAQAIADGQQSIADLTRQCESIAGCHAAHSTLAQATCGWGRDPLGGLEPPPELPGNHGATATPSQTWLCGTGPFYVSCTRD